MPDAHPAIATGRLLSIQVGLPRDMLMPETHADQWPGAWRSAIYKEAVHGAVAVTRGGITGDGQTDLKNHGGPDNVVLAYAGAHYPVWRERLALPELGHGGFGENFTVEGEGGFADETVCIGDVWRVGPSLVLQVTQARQPCFKLARRLGRVDVVKQVRANGWGGWYMRVLQEGTVEAGMTIEHVERRHPEWPVVRAVQVMYGRKAEPGLARVLAAVPELSARWKRELVERGD